MNACRLAYTVQVTFFKVPEKHGRKPLKPMFTSAWPACPLPPPWSWWSCSSTSSSARSGCGLDPGEYTILSLAPGGVRFPRSLQFCVCTTTIYGGPRSRNFNLGSRTSLHPMQSYNSSLAYAWFVAKILFRSKSWHFKYLLFYFNLYFFLSKLKTKKTYLAEEYDGIDDLLLSLCQGVLHVIQLEKVICKDDIQTENCSCMIASYYRYIYI